MRIRHLATCLATVTILASATNAEEADGANLDGSTPDSFRVDLPERVPASEQERAYASAIWYTP